MHRSFLETKKTSNKAEEITKYKDDAPFRFKHLVVHHHVSTLKVNTDGVLLAAWASPQVKGNYGLDIGSGSGVIALILAQEHPNLSIKGIDIHHDSVGQANFNAQVNQLSERLSFEVADATQWKTDRLYDLVISNPPFFANSTQSKLKETQMAKHVAELSIQRLIESVSSSLSATGLFFVVFPASSQQALIEQVRLCGLFVQAMVKVCSFPDTEPFNIMYCIVRERVDAVEESIVCIYERPGVYHKKYRSLTRNLYLKF